MGSVGGEFGNTARGGCIVGWKVIRRIYLWGLCGMVLFGVRRLSGLLLNMGCCNLYGISDRWLLVDVIVR